MRTYDQYLLFSSPLRNNWYYKQIKIACKDKVCLDIGTGSGILSLFALHSGATHVYMVDHNKECCELAQNVMQQANIDKSRYTIINAEFSDVLKELPNIDVVISELICGNLFEINLEEIYKLVKQSKNTENAVLIPDTIYGSLSIFTNTEMFGIIDKHRKDNEVEGNILTGVREIDENYSINSSLFGKKFNQSERYKFGKQMQNRSDYNYLAELRESAIQSTIELLKNVIHFDFHNPNINEVWTATSNLPNGDYGIMLIGSLACSQIKDSTLHIMQQDLWPTHLYKFNKTSNTIRIKYDRDPNINDVVFF